MISAAENEAPGCPEPASAIPIDQVIIEEPKDRKVLMLPPGRFWLRTIDRDSKVIAEAHVGVP